MPQFHSTRLFPKGLGAASYRLTGIAARCDWALLTDSVQPFFHLYRTVKTATPRHIFLSLREERHAIPAFVETVLPLLTEPFVLVSGSEDVTIPRQIDTRRPAFTSDLIAHIQTILNHPLLLHWFAENLVDVDPRLSALPVGMVYSVTDPEVVAEPADRPSTGERPCRALCSHRVREGRQWDPRRHVTGLAQTAWAPFCTVLTLETPEPEFLSLVASHAFVLCVEGGGLDPSPKAWQCVLYGAIPIIRRTPTSVAYEDLPVVIVDAWNADALDADRMAGWQRSLAPRFDDPDQRGEVLRRLGGDYWWDKIASKARP